MFRDTLQEVNLEPGDIPKLQQSLPENDWIQGREAELALEKLEKSSKNFERDAYDTSEESSLKSTDNLIRDSPSSADPRTTTRKGFWFSSSKFTPSPIPKPKPEPIDSAKESLKRYREMLSAESKTLVETCPKFRVLLLGKAGKGKTTLCSHILGVAYNVSISSLGPSILDFC